MKNMNLYKKIIASTMALALVMTSFTGCAKKEEASTDSDKVVEAKEETVIDVTAGAGNAEKAETVYVIADKTGSVESITVSDWLKNTDNYETIEDTTNLSDVIMIKGAANMNQSGSDLSFEANGKDVYYRGSLAATTTLPVSVSISYTLDGKEISADEVDGATGKLGINIKYTNNTSYTANIDGKDKEIHVPFLAATMVVVSSDVAKNIEIDHGRIADNDDTNIIVGYGFPGLNESFGVAEGVFTDTVAITMDVVDYKADACMTLVTSEMFASSSLDEAVDADTLTESLEEVTDFSLSELSDIESVDDIEDMLDEISDKVTELSDGAEALKDGADQLYEGMDKISSTLALLNDKMSTVYDGGYTLSKKMTEAATAGQALSDGASQVSGGIDQLQTAMTGMYTTIATTIEENNGKLAKLQAALSQLSPTSSEYMTYYAQYNQLAGANAALQSIKDQMDQGKLAENLAALSAGASQVATGTAQLSDGLNKMSAANNQLYDGLTKLADACKQMADGSVQLVDGTKKLSDGAGEMAEGTKKLTKAFDGNLNPLVDTAKALKEAAQHYNSFTSIKEGTEGHVSFVIKTE